MRRVMGGGPAVRAWPVLACALALALGPAAASAVAQGSEVLQVAPGGTDPTCASPCASVQVAVNRAGHDLQSGAASSALIVVARASFSGNVTIPALSATTPLAIQGAGPSTVLVGTGAGSVVTVPAGSRVAITDLSIEGGKAVNGGGASNAGDLSLLRDTIALNAAISPNPTAAGTGLGGGIFNSGSLILQDSTVSNNQASSGGAGVEISYGTLNAARDALVANTVGPDEGAGGVYVFGGTVDRARVVGGVLRRASSLRGTPPAAALAPTRRRCGARRGASSGCAAGVPSSRADRSRGHPHNVAPTRGEGSAPCLRRQALMSPSPLGDSYDGSRTLTDHG
jgi:hypothetical protein